MSNEAASSNESEVVWDDVPVVQEPAYRIDERPATWWESILYGWQHTLVDISPFVLPLAVAGAIGMAAAEKAQFINSCLLAMGLATLIQTTVGNRLPIIQGPSATLTGTLAPIGAQLGAPAMWGGAFVGALLESLVGASRVLGQLRRLFPAAVSGVVIVAIGLALGQFAVRLAIGDGGLLGVGLAVAVIGLIFVLQIALRDVAGGILARGAIFLSIWIVGLIGGSLLGEVDWSLVADKPWLGVPRLFPYGGPGFGWEFTYVAIFGVAVGYFGSMVESLGDYAATCAVSGETYRVKHMNRGIFAEGVGSLLATCLGSIPCTSYTQNVGIIAATGVASRFVVRIAAVILVLYGLCPKFGALLVAMPRSVLGGVFVLVCGMIVSSGVRLLAAAAPTTANSFVIGTTLVGAITVPIYTRYALGEVWLEALPAIARLLFTNTVVLAVILAVGLNLLLNILLGGAREDG